MKGVMARRSNYPMEASFGPPTVQVKMKIISLVPFAVLMTPERRGALPPLSAAKIKMWTNLRSLVLTTDVSDGGVDWTPELPLDVSCYGYPGGLQMEDGSLLISYCESGKAPNRVYIIRFQVNPTRDGIKLLNIGNS